MDRDGAHGIVDFQNVIEEAHGDGKQQAGHDADDGGTGGRDHVASGGDGHKACQRGVESHAHVRLLVAQPGIEHGHAAGNGRGHVGVDEDQSGGDHGVVAVHGHGGAAVETEPAEPQDEDAQRTQGEVMAQDGTGRAVLFVLADAGAQDGRADAGADAADHVDRSGTGKVMEAQLAQPAAAPDPVAGDGIDEGGDAERVDAVGDKFGPLRHGAGDDGGRGGTENRLEDKVGEERDPCGEDGRIVALNHGVQSADQRTAAGEHQTEAQKPVGGRSDAEVH